MTDRRMNQIMICGDSYMTPDVNFPETHFTELLCKKLNCEPLIYARGGMSNLGICLQIEQIFRCDPKPDLILFNHTSSDRIEVPLIPVTDYQGHSREYNILDVIYSEQNSITTYSSYLNKQGPNFVSDTLGRILNMPNSYPEMSKEVRTAIKDYFQFIHFDGTWKRQIDCWALHACIHKLELSKIPYFYCVTDNENPNPYLPEFVEEKNILRLWKELPVDPIGLPGYHTTIEHQVEYSNMFMDAFRKRLEP